MVGLRDSIVFQGETLRLVWKTCQVGSPALLLVDADGSPYVKASVWIADAALPPGEMVIKDSDENAGIFDDLVSAGVVEATGDTCAMRIDPVPRASDSAWSRACPWRPVVLY
ncbi:MAG: hypothetical protein C7B45_03455 [Sulfobacillus acidophilus]|uniref:Uncharacterized protein n=1 Tax=Sulfobacillus acidophilus TaxID=53633 RepID=A0A2T2WMC3_9FIRM|nr:MAG: hypothetical protein C7B45_03455 [Sulfobacillus acidophilus]